MNILMPMAGEGSRTKGRSTLPKPFIPILGLPMFHWAVSSANIKAHKIFVIRGEHRDLVPSIEALYPGSSLVIQDGPLNGAVLSCLLASDLIVNEPLLIMDCDMSVSLDYRDLVKDNPDIGVSTFTSQSPSYSYVSDNGLVIEKKVVSSNAVAGSFYWKNGSDFVKYAKKTVSKGKTLNNEFYMSSAINEAVLDGLAVTTYTSNNAYDLSTDTGTKGFIDDFYNQNLGNTGGLRSSS
jgi:bifunctional N-acetylglucosamine-1-phosphate-uridyltransferase/glucosamine-1-phosphate-acetyltransferase GlmU-like protein